MASITERVGQLASGDQPAAFAAHRELALEAFSAAAPGHDAERAALAGELAKALADGQEATDANGKPTRRPYPALVRGQLARLLADVAGGEQVPALVAALGDYEVREAARWALTRIPDAAATAALVAIVRDAVAPELRIGAIGALASRSGDDVLSALKHAALDHDPEVRTAAAEALAALPEPTNDQVLTAVLKFGEPSPRIRTRIMRSRVRLADNLAQHGQKEAARAIWQSIAETGDAEADAAQIAAAKRGLAGLSA